MGTNEFSLRDPYRGNSIELITFDLGTRIANGFLQLSISKRYQNPIHETDISNFVYFFRILKRL